MIVEISYHVDHNGTHVWSTSNTYDGTTQVHSTQLIDPQLVLTIYDRENEELPLGNSRSSQIGASGEEPREGNDQLCAKVG